MFVYSLDVICHLYRSVPRLARWLLILESKLSLGVWLRDGRIADLPRVDDTLPSAKALNIDIEELVDLCHTRRALHRSSSALITNGTKRDCCKKTVDFLR